MSTMAATWTEEVVEVAGQSLHLVKGGSGAPLLILHGEMGHAGWLRYHEALAQHYAVTLPVHPGFGKTARVDWVRNMRDLASWYLEALDDLGLDGMPVLGCGLGGWLAAEMAAASPKQFAKLIVASAPGIRPPQGEIFDMFLAVAKEYIDQGFVDPAKTSEYQELYGGEVPRDTQEIWFHSREESSRLTWRPYMHDLTLPPRLHRLKQVPTLVLWGREDAIVPVSAGEAYQKAIPGSQLVVIDGCGHYPEIEQADAFVACVEDFLRK
jgi:pimeloyl-ACP methyl ester carboxylesterase